MDKNWTPETSRMVICNPAYVISIDPRLAVEHPPLLRRTEWVAANVQLIEKIGSERWLQTLLDGLEGGFIDLMGPVP